VTNVGDVANTAEPEPVSSVKAPRSWAEVNEPKDVALPTLVTAPVKLALVMADPAIRPRAVPVAFVATNADGVPKSGVTNVGELANTKAPVPVSSVTAARKLADEGVPKNVATPVPKPATPVEIGKPVALIKSAWPTVPSVGLVITGLVNRPVTVTCLVVVPWTNGISSVPVKGVVAKGSWVIFTLAKMYPLLVSDGRSNCAADHNINALVGVQARVEVVIGVSRRRKCGDNHRVRRARS